MHEALQKIRKLPRRTLLGIGAVGLAGAIFAAYSLGGHKPGQPQQVPTIQPNKNGGLNLLKGQWGYLPGVQMQDGKLQVGYRNFQIVEQDGSGGQANPPVNVYGTSLRLSGGFALHTTLSKLKGRAALDFYGSKPGGSPVPEISDEFRVETPRVRTSVNGDHLTVQEWDGNGAGDLAHQAPIITRTFPVHVGEDESIALDVSDQSGNLHISADGNEVGEVPDHHIFAGHTIYFGMEAGTPKTPGSFVVSKFTARPLGGGRIETVDLSATPALHEDPNGLQHLVAKKRKGFLLGSSAATWALTDPHYRQIIFGGNFKTITPENDMKWQNTEPQPGLFDFHAADALVDMAHKNNMKVWGHNLVFSESLPDWVQNLHTNTPEEKAYVQKIMVRHITEMVAHFKGKVIGWDVVNEPIKDYDDNGDFDSSQPYRENVFYRAMGADYIRIAFEAAHKADPHALLAINEWGFSGLTNNSDDDRATAISSMLSTLTSQGVPWNVFGDQAHIYDAGPGNDDIVDSQGRAPILAARIRQVAALGKKYRISEADAPLSGDPGDGEPDYGGSSQAQQFIGELDTCLANDRCIGMSFWSVGKTDMWQGDGHELHKRSVDSLFGQNNKLNTSGKVFQRALR